MTTKLKVTHNNINKLVNAIHTSITTYLSDKTDNDNIQWRRTWDKWKSTEKPRFLAIRRRREFAEAILGNDDGSPQTKKILQEIFHQIPVLDEIYEFVTDSISGHTFMQSWNVQNIEFARKQTVIEAERTDGTSKQIVSTPNTSDNEKWSEIASKSKHSSPARESVSKAIATDTISTGNRFEILEVDDDNDEEEAQGIDESKAPGADDDIIPPPLLRTTASSLGEEDTTTINSPNNQSNSNDVWMVKMTQKSSK